MIQKYYGYAAVAVLALFLLAPSVRSQSVSSGGVFSPIEDTVLGGVYTWVGNLSPLVIAGTADDGFETTLTFAQPTGSHVWTFPATTDTFVGRATTDTFTNKTLTAPTITNPQVQTELVTASGGTETLTIADCGQTVLLDTATGSVVTLPTSVGAGCWFRFAVTVTLSSGTHDIVLGAAADDMAGALTVVSTTIANSDTFFIVDGSDNDTIQMDGNTEGGEAGSMIFMQDISAGLWFVHGDLVGVGTTPTTAFLTGQVQ